MSPLTYSENSPAVEQGHSQPPISRQIVAIHQYVLQCDAFMHPVEFLWVILNSEIT
jgi:hypothetical protein